MFIIDKLIVCKLKSNVRRSGNLISGTAFYYYLAITSRSCLCADGGMLQI